MRNAIVIAAAGLVGLLACDGGGSGGPMGPVSDIEGTYQATHTIEITSGITLTVTCIGPLVILTQTGSSFSGTVAIEECTLIDDEPDFPAGFSGTIDDGTLEIDFGVDLAEAFAAEFEDCTVISADDTFRGTASGSTLDVSLAAELVCDGLPVEIGWRIVADRA